ncbi:MAG: hypothetical protein IJ334_13250 [Clostridia bacterium]|nr:hypothetical protein [Clostridia bacterium]
MEIREWQKNEKDWTDYPEYSSLSDFYFERIPLKLKEGETVDTTYDRSKQSSEYVWSAIIDVIYDGNITGSCNIVIPYMVDYTGETDRIPSYRVTGENVRRSDDATFEGNRQMSLSVRDFSHDLADSLDHSLPVDQRGSAEATLRNCENMYGIRWKDHYRTEQFIHVYPEAAAIGLNDHPNMKQFKLVIMTMYLTIHAMHQLKEDTPVATAVLEITSYSRWFGKLTAEELSYVGQFCDRNLHYSTVKVVSYEQSDFFAME